MSTEFLFNRGALRRARTAWDEKRERNGEKAAKLSAKLRELCICASPALQSLATNAGVAIEQLKTNRTPIYGLRRYRGVGQKRQIGPESLQWRDLDIDWESHSGKAFQETICNEWLALIRRLDVFLKANNLVGGLDTAAVTDAVLACRAVTRDSHAAEIFRLLEGMRFESSEWEQMMSHLEDYLAKSQCALCSAVIGREGHLCGDCTAIVETFKGFLMLWDIAPVEVCSDFSSWIELKDSACQLFGYQLFTHTTLNELELWLAQRCQEGEPVDSNMKTIVELVRRAITMNSNGQTGEIGPNHDRFTSKRFESVGGDQNQDTKIPGEQGRDLEQAMSDDSSEQPSNAGKKRPNRRDAKEWLHEPGSQPPNDFIVEKWLTGHQTELGFAIYPSGIRTIKTRALLDHFKKAAENWPTIWCRVAAARGVELFFKNAADFHCAENRLSEYRRQSPPIKTAANSSERNHVPLKTVRNGKSALR